MKRFTTSAWLLACGMGLPAAQAADLSGSVKFTNLAFTVSDNIVPFLGNASVAETFADGATALSQVTGNSVVSQATGPTDTNYLIHGTSTSWARSTPPCYYGEESSYTKTRTTSLSAPSQSFSAPVALSYANNSGEDQFLGLVVHADVWVSNTATAVPEPGTWALALAAAWWRPGV